MKAVFLLKNKRTEENVMKKIFILSLEECIRFGILIFVFRRKKWMQQLSV